MRAEDREWERAKRSRRSRVHKRSLIHNAREAKRVGGQGGGGRNQAEQEKEIYIPGERLWMEDDSWN